MSGHTLGPWCIYPETDGTEICAVDMVPRLPIRQLICRPIVGDNWLANARLIAAAPDLLAALIQILERYTALANSGDAGFWDCELEPQVLASRAAIAKAIGVTF